jgi:hypothetical protein
MRFASLRTAEARDHGQHEAVHADVLSPRVPYASLIVIAKADESPTLIVCSRSPGQLLLRHCVVPVLVVIVPAVLTVVVVSVVESLQAPAD